MKLSIWGQNIKVMPSLRRYIDQRLNLELGRFRTRVERVGVRIVDLNGPRGGADKRCRIVACVAPLGEVVAEATDSSLLTAINAAADRTGRAVAHELDRKRSKRFRDTPWWRQRPPSML